MNFLADVIHSLQRWAQLIHRWVQVLGAGVQRLEKVNFTACDVDDLQLF